MADSNSLIFIILAVVVLLGTAIVLTILERRVKRKVKAHQQREKGKDYYKNRIDKIKRIKNSEESLYEIDNLLREFANKNFGFSKSKEYTEIAEEFNKLKKKELSKIYFKISELAYSGKEIKREELDSLINSLNKVLPKYKKPVN